MRRVFTGIVGLALAGMAFGQSWTSSYDAGLKAARAGKWEEARKAFKQSKAARPDDVEKPTMLPGPVTEQRKWRNGSPYSPNFLAAYAEYRMGVGMTGDNANGHLRTASDELESLISKKQVSRESVYVLFSIYGKLGLGDKKNALAAKISEPNWKVDNEVMTPEEISAMSSGVASSTANGGIVGVVDAGKMVNGTANPSTPGTLVPVISTKYALIISNGDNKLPGLQLTHAVDDASVLKESLSLSAGYDPANIEIVTNATAAKILASVKALATRMPAESTLFFFYTGAGANIDGRDWFAGVNTEIATDTSSMVKKSDVFQPFMAKGVSIFAFYQVPRTAMGGKAFGEEEPRSGRIAQMQSTMVGDSIYSLYKRGKTVGVFADAVCEVMNDLHSNSIPISDFGWAVFYKIRTGGSGESGGGSKQTPTLPVLQFLTSNSRF
ncbi:MAG: caspase family protein [Armatimonadota bacterium]